MLAHLSGNRIVELVREDLPLSQFLTPTAFANAIRANAALGGSTNAVVHLLALAGRAGVPLTLADWDRLGRDIPCIVNLKPSGAFLMEEFHDAGGFPVVLRTLIEAGLRRRRRAHRHRRARWPSPAPPRRNFRPDVIRPLADPVQPQGGIAVLRGNLAPDGAVIKPSAATPALLRHRGRAVVFESIEHYHARIADPALEVDAGSVLVLKGCGPRGYPGMPECGNMGLPPKLLRQGITDMVRISDARMSGTAYGTVVLHVAPESAVGGPLALVRDGDEIELDVPRRRLELLVDAGRAGPPPGRMARRRLRRVRAAMSACSTTMSLQADKGCDFDFLVGRPDEPGASGGVLSVDLNLRQLIFSIDELVLIKS